MEEISALIFGHKSPDTDSICSSLVQEKFDHNNGYNTKAVRLGNINKETQYVLDYLKMEAPTFIETIEDGQAVILVDHNEFTQSVDNIENANILMVVDHHRIANFHTNDPLYYLAKPYGCTATILYEQFLAHGMKIEKQEAVLMLSAIISDTLLFKSPTCTKYDKHAAEELAKIAEMDITTYGLDMLKAGTDLSDFTPEQIIHIDCKEFVANEKYTFRIAQVNTASIEEVLKSKEQLEQAIQDDITTNKENTFILLITDIINNNSQAIVLGDTTVFEKAFAQKLENHMAFLEGVVSRKKQVAPVLLKNINES